MDRINRVVAHLTPENASFTDSVPTSSSSIPMDPKETADGAPRSADEVQRWKVADEGSRASHVVNDAVQSTVTP